MAVDPGNVHHGFFAAAPIPSRLPAQRGRPVGSVGFPHHARNGKVADEKKKRQTDARRGLLSRRVPSCWSKISFLFLPTTSTGGNAPLCQHFPPSTLPPFIATPRAGPQLLQPASSMSTQQLQEFLRLHHELHDSFSWRSTSGKVLFLVASPSSSPCGGDKIRVSA